MHHIDLKTQSPCRIPSDRPSPSPISPGGGGFLSPVSLRRRGARSAPVGLGEWSLHGGPTINDPGEPRAAPGAFLRREAT